MRRTGCFSFNSLRVPGVLGGSYLFLLFFLPGRRGFLLIELCDRIRQPSCLQLPSPPCRTAPPFCRAFVPCNLRQTAFAEHRLVQLVDVVSLPVRVVVFLDQQPFIPLAPRTPSAHLDEREISVQLLAFQPKLQVAFGQHRGSFGVRTGNVLSVHRDRRKRLPRAHVPNHHCAGAVVVLGNDAFKIEIRNRMILNLHGETFVTGIERRALGNGPRFEHSVHFQPKVVMQSRGVMLLHDETVPSLLLHFRKRFWRFLEAQLLLIFLQCHASAFYQLRKAFTLQVMPEFPLAASVAEPSPRYNPAVESSVYEARVPGNPSCRGWSHHHRRSACSAGEAGSSSAAGSVVDSGRSAGSRRACTRSGRARSSRGNRARRGTGRTARRLRPRAARFRATGGVSLCAD